MKNYEKMDDEMLRLAAISIHKNAIAEYEALEDGKDLITEKEIAKQWNAVMKKHRQRKYHRMLSSLRGEFLKKAAAVIAALSVLGGGVTATVVAVNPQIREQLNNDFDDHSMLSIIFSDKKPEVPDEWNERYYPTYMPSGFDYMRMDDFATQSTLYYQKDGDILRFAIYPAETNIGINTENMTFRDLDINGTPSKIYTNVEDTSSILMMFFSECIIRISGSMQSSEAILVGESVCVID